MFIEFALHFLRTGIAIKYVHSNYLLMTIRGGGLLNYCLISVEFAINRVADLFDTPVGLKFKAHLKQGCATLEKTPLLSSG